MGEAFSRSTDAALTYGYEISWALTMRKLNKIASVERLQFVEPMYA